jgi:hypothetical protein
MEINIGILYICTGRCDVFWDGFYKSAQKYLFTDKGKYKKHYFVFTDSKNINTYSNNNIKIIPTKYLGYPYDTLMRYHTFLSAENEIKNMDYLYYFNANSRMIEKIDEDILPDNDDIVVTTNIYYANIKKVKLPVESNIKSKAYIDINDNRFKTYVIGALFGARSTIFISMCKELKDNIDIDLKNNIIARWHDESHLNHYLLTYPYKLLPPEYSALEFLLNIFTNLKCKIFLEAKGKYGGLNYLRYTDIKSDNRKFFG